LTPMVADVRCREARGASRGNADPVPVEPRGFPHLAVRASQQACTAARDRRYRSGITRLVTGAAGVVKQHQHRRPRTIKTSFRGFWWERARITCAPYQASGSSSPS
jgi:hypothetical protein